MRSTENNKILSDIKNVDNIIEEYFNKHNIRKGHPLFDSYYNFNIKKAPLRARHIVHYISKKLNINNLSSLDILDIGAGTGAVSAEFAKKGARAIGIEKDKELVTIGKKLYDVPLLELTNEDFISDNLSFNKKFDIILLIDVVEHIKDQDKLFTKAISILKRRGRLIILTPNRLCPYDPEYGLWFINYLPKRLADRYVKLFGKENTVGGKEKGFGVYPLSVFELKKILRKKGLINLDIEIGSELISYKAGVLSKIVNCVKKNPILIMFGSPLSIVGEKIK